MEDISDRCLYEKKKREFYHPVFFQDFSLHILENFNFVSIFHFYVFYYSSIEF